ncbi:hypothetical protein [Planomonospora venezuelensis]|uniref:Uncharacterized protein n=1 Tax=Planomonospora venezuelensis TaxID=1999 RepID=A0A841DA65_PLAVE|nr:hypothetical protein [Planomonospora venezuelensis]MBB5965364.1 hypothetical protein [Planomonospora venezuelensis]GIN05131.1 hypothetical protein Pve01_67890 [Planomonospora venezuelensis]
MTVSPSGTEDEPFVPRRLRNPADDPPPPPGPPMNRWVRRLLLLLLFVVMAAVLGTSLRGVRLPSPSSDEGSSRCVDTSSRQADGTHPVVDDRNCGDGADRRYRWEEPDLPDGRDRGVLELIKELLDGRR